MTISGFCILSLIQDHCCLSTPEHCSVGDLGKMSCPTQISGRCVASTVAVLAGGALIGYIVGYKLGQRSARCNYKIQLDSNKVADTVDIEDIGEKKAFCRCWKSEKWPYCDGSHGKHNKETGDNVGPLIVKSEKK
ncbi:hypothetical protein L5515_014326 [Caenorhabditis briggsae]|uniref:CDGSH iron-sulfur domain-containing protein 2 homologue n=2 Tax=Caenorhabditis briggsae TaxID=6238 RepID=A0AAE9DJI8_CAEBR|nr:hypothetical protein L3Y34_018204 [Caenorhabditis briggsae]UMM18099.1 hypothetical protein L5515_014326 [Caenorhabditis briggsae]